MSKEIWIKDKEQVEVELPPPELKILGEKMYEMATNLLKAKGFKKQATKQGADK